MDQSLNFSLADAFAILWQKKFRILFAGLLGVLGAGGFAWSLAPIFVAEGQVVVRAASSVASDADHSFYSSVVSDAVIATERAVIGATGIASRIAENVQLPPSKEGLVDRWIKYPIRQFIARYTPPVAPIDPADQARIAEDSKVSRIMQALSTGADKGSSVIEVYAKSEDPKLSAKIVNTALTLYLDDRVVSQNLAAKLIESALRDRLQQTNSKIDATEQRISSLLAQPGLVEDSQIPNQSRAFTLVGSRLAQARADLASRQATYSSVIGLRDAASGDPSKLIEMLDEGSSSTADLRHQFSQSQQDLSRIAADVGRSHPRYIVAQQAMVGLTSRLAGEAQRIVAQRQAELTAAQQVVNTLSQQYDALRKNSTNIAPALLDVDQERDTLGNLRRIAGGIEDRLISITAQPVDPNARVLTWAKPPITAAYPNKAMFVGSGLIAGLVVSVAFVLLREYRKRLKPSLAYPAEVLSGPLLGYIPEGRVHRLSKPLATIFQGIALELESTLKEKDFKVVAITSGLPNEGKTTVAAHLGLAMSQLGKRVLVINCDLHNRAVSSWWAGKGSKNLRSKSAPMPEFVVSVQKNLDVIPLCVSGVEDPVLYLRSQEFKRIIENARREYDLVLCDTPPVLSVPDALVVSREADSILLISARQTEVDRAMANEISRRVLTAGRPICGVIVTKADASEVKTAYYSGYGPQSHTRSLFGVMSTPSSSRP